MRRVNSFICYVVFVFFLLILVASSSYGLNAKSWRAPSLVNHFGDLHLLFKGHNNYYIWDALNQGGSWYGLGAINDSESPTSWTFTSLQPTSLCVWTSIYGWFLNYRLQLVFKGHNNNHVWYTSKRLDWVYGWKWDTPRYIPGSYTFGTPAATVVTPGVSEIAVAYAGTNASSHGPCRIYLRRGSGYEGCTWSPESPLPPACITDSGISMTSYDGNRDSRSEFYIFYKGFGTNQIYVARSYDNTCPMCDPNSWTVSPLPQSYTGVNSDSVVGVVNHEDSIIVAYKGYNNNYIWLRRSFDGVNWQRLGYIQGITTYGTPSLAAMNDTLYLAYIPNPPWDYNYEICVGTLELDDWARPARPAHRWTSIR